MENNNIKVRFAPSPTGFLHVGGLRTVLFNYFFAKKNKGKFLLRIEDTDQTRCEKKYLSNIFDILEKFNIKPDEDVIYQSQRLEIYQKYIKILLEKNLAYYCFCDQKSDTSDSFGYPGTCRNLSSEQIENNLNQNKKFTIRLKVPKDEKIVFDDLITGKIEIDTNQIDDQILIKSDGFPTYHFANVIDDHLTGITHVIRGEEWITSVPKHILLYKAFGWEIPKMAHVPLILNKDRKKYSKRDGSSSVSDFLSEGYLPSTLLNFLSLLGWNKGSGSTKEIFSLKELINDFSLSNVHKSGAIFDLDKLDWMNKEYIKKINDDDFISLVKNNSKFITNDEKKFQKIAFSIKNRIKKFSDVDRELEIYFVKPQLSDEQLKFLNNDNSKKILSLLIDKLNYWDETADQFKTFIKNIKEETNISGLDLFQPIRYTLTGKENGPDLAVIADILGKEEVLQRMAVN